MQIGKRYIFIGADGETSTGVLVSLTDKTITYKHKSDENYQNTIGKYGEGKYHIPRELIVKSFLMDELIPGQRYIFKFTDKEFSSGFVSISGNYETIHCYDDNQCRNSFPLYWIKNIEIV
jgi:hypothetical protein